MQKRQRHGTKPNQGCLLLFGHRDLVKDTSPRTNHKSLPVRFKSTYFLTSLFVNLPPRDFFESKLHSKRSLDLATQPGFHLLDLFHRDDPTPHLGQRSSSQPVFHQAQSKTNRPRSVPWGSPQKGVFSMGHHFHDMYAVPWVLSIGIFGLTVLRHIWKTKIGRCKAGSIP